MILNPCLPLHTLSIIENSPVCIGVKLQNKLPEDIKDKRSLQGYKKA